jgi:hypothetical protein
MPNNKSQPNHKNHKKKLDKRTAATTIKVVIFENSIAANASAADIKRASYLFNNIQRKIIKSRISPIHLN